MVSAANVWLITVDSVRFQVVSLPKRANVRGIDLSKTSFAIGQEIDKLSSATPMWNAHSERCVPHWLWKLFSSNLVKFFVLLPLLFLFPLLSQTCFPLDFQFFGHRDVIWRIRSDVQYIYTSSADGSLKVWDENLHLVQSIPTHESWARALAVSDKFVAVGGYKPDNTIKIYDKGTFKLHKVLKVHSGSVFTLEFYGDILVSGGSDNWIILTDVKTWSSRFLKIHDAWVREIMVVKNSLVSVDDFGKVVVTDLESFSVVKQFRIDGLVTSATSDGVSRCFFGDSKGNIWILDLTTGQLFKKVVESGKEIPIETLEYVNNQLYCGMANLVYRFETRERDLKLLKKFSASPIDVTSVKLFKGKLFLGNKYGELYVYTPEGRYLRKSQRYGQTQIKISTYGKLLVVGKESGDLEVYDNESGKLLWKLTMRSPIRSVMFNKFRKEEVTAGCADGTLAFVSSGKLTRVLKFSDAITSLFEMNRYVLAGTNQQLLLIDVGQRSPVVRTFSISGWVTAIRVLPSTFPKVYAGTNTGEVYIFDLSNSLLKLSGKIQLDNGIVSFAEVGSKNIVALTFSGKLYMIQGNRSSLLATVKPPVYALSTVGNEVLVVGGAVYSVNLSNTSVVRKIFESEVPFVDGQYSNGHLLLALSNGRVLDVEYIPGKSPRLVKGYVPELSPFVVIQVIDKENIVCGHENGEISLWKKIGPKTKFELDKVLVDHATSVRDLVAYKNYILSASSDRTIKVWDRKGGRLLNTVTCHNSYVWALEEAGNVLISGDWEGKVYIWDISAAPENLKKIAEYNTGSSVSDLRYWKGGVVFSTLEGEVGIVRNNHLVKKRVARQTLWTISVDEKYIFAAGWDGIVFVLDGSLNLVARLKAHNSTIFKLERFNNVLLTAGSDNLIKIWEVSEDGGKITLRLKYTYSDFRQSILAVAFSKETEEIIVSQGQELVAFKIGRKGGTN